MRRGPAQYAISRIQHLRRTGLVSLGSLLGCQVASSSSDVNHTIPVVQRKESSEGCSVYVLRMFCTGWKDVHGIDTSEFVRNNVLGISYESLQFEHTVLDSCRGRS